MMIEVYGKLGWLLLQYFFYYFYCIVLFQITSKKIRKQMTTHIISAAVAEEVIIITGGAHILTDHGNGNQIPIIPAAKVTITVLPGLEAPKPFVEALPENLQWAIDSKYICPD
jgi:hypothetical protein